MSDLKKFLKKYDFPYPNELIAQSPASPRDTARLLVYNRTTKKIRFDTFLNLPKYLPPHSVLVFNQTKVIPARIEVKKETGGKAVLLYLSHDKKLITVLSDRKLKVGTTLTLSRNITCGVHAQNGKYYYLCPSFPPSSIIPLLTKYGRTPLPPYIKHTLLSEPRLRREYQTIFAKQNGSIAAPTASLHFTARLMRALKLAGHEVRFVTLHVGLGTFAPLNEDNIKTGMLHKEYYSVTPSTTRALNRAKEKGHPIIAVGTTVVRTLESCSNAQGQLHAMSGSTSLFIKEGYRFKCINGMITNFHVPQSSLLILVSAFANRDITLNLYRSAIDNKFNLFSFGDGMLLL